MATPRGTKDIANKKTKGLIDHKKIQKEKTLAKRAAAAEGVKAKKTLSAPVAVVFANVAPVQDESADEGETHSMMKEVEECIKEMTIKQPLDIVAHRKALEAALYDNMETPRQMLARCKYTASIDAEHHPVDGDEVANEADRSENDALSSFRSTLKCLDDNCFEITPMITGLTEDNLTTPTKTTSSLALLRLFDLVKDAGQTKVGAFGSSVSFAPDSGEATECDEIIVNLPDAGRHPHGPVNMGHMPSVSGARVNAKPVEVRTLESVETEMRLSHDKSSFSAPPLVDPAIIRYKIKGQALVVVDNHAQMTSSSTDDRGEDSNMLRLFTGCRVMSSRSLSPTSSHRSRASSPVDPHRAFTPSTRYSVSPPPELPVWFVSSGMPSYVDPRSVW
ncbi:unnamed protein product [Alternaria burnsii]|nr:unnamed protein product [Alternaria burnsii]